MPSRSWGVGGVGVWGGVHIRCLGNGLLWFRSYSGSLLKSAKVSKTLLPHHSAPRLGSVCPNEGLNPWAAATRHPWRGAANPASCRVTHGFKPAFGQRGLTGRLGSRSRSRSKTEPEQTAVSLTNGDPNVGAGLLANAVCQSINSLADPPHSRASPLPHLDLHVSDRQRSALALFLILILILILILGAPLNHAGRTQA